MGRDSHSLYQNRSAKQQHEIQNVSCQLYKKSFIVKHYYLNYSLKYYTVAVQQIKDVKWNQNQFIPNAFF